MPSSKKHHTWILNSFLSDIECEKLKRSARNYYNTSTPKKSQHIPAKSENVQSTLNATWLLFALKGNVQHFCNELQTLFNDEFMKYLHSPDDTLAFIKALPLNWEPLKQTWIMIEDEISKLIWYCSELECDNAVKSELFFEDDASNAEMIHGLPNFPVQNMMAPVDYDDNSWSLNNLALKHVDDACSTGSFKPGATSEIISGTLMKKLSISDCANSDTVPLVLQNNEDEGKTEKTNITSDPGCEDILNMVPCNSESSDDLSSLQLSLNTWIASKPKKEVKMSEESPDASNTIGIDNAKKMVNCVVQISKVEKQICDHVIKLFGLAPKDGLKTESKDNSLHLPEKSSRKKHLSEIENNPSVSTILCKRRRISSASETSSQSSHDSGSNISAGSRLTISATNSYGSVGCDDSDVDDLMDHVFSEDEEEDNNSVRSSLTDVTKPFLRSKTKLKASANENNNCKKVTDPGAAWRRDPLLNEPLEEKEHKTQDTERSKRRGNYPITDFEISNLVDEQPNTRARESPTENELPKTGQSSKKGRKNLREIIAEEDLDVLTQAATAAERERIERLQQRQLSQISTEESVDNDLVLDDSGDDRIVVHRNLTRKLKEHQKIGVRFMWDNCYETAARARMYPGAGCILAHCMGLGKTLQVITLIHTLFKHHVAGTRRVLVICPTSIVLNWCKEFKMAFKIVNDASFNMPVITMKRNAAMSERARTIEMWKQNGGVMLLGYDGFASVARAEMESTNAILLDPGPDLVVCDEGHILKNGRTLRTQVISRIKTKRRIILTGTPMQNNLEEYYHMVSFVKPAILGTYKEYRNRFMNPITNGQYENSSHDDIQLMKKRSHVLHKMTKGFIQRFEESELKQYLPEKFEYVLKIELHALQVKLYKKYFRICNERQKRLFADERVFHMIHTHPKLLTMQAREGAILAEALVENHDWWKDDLPNKMDMTIKYGPKFSVMMTIVDECLKKREKVLIFSNSIDELTLIESFLQASKRRLKPERDYYRMDGRLPAIKRHQYCSTFNEPGSSVKLFLLTNRVGGLGLNLTGANRAILMDVSWNPTLDTQSIFRIYRLGQNKPCYIYRLVAKGTMEEVIYERSVTKQAIAGRVVDEMQITRHFNESELEAMYRCNLDFPGLNKPTPKLPTDAILAKLLTRHACIFTYHNHNDLLQNLPDEELNEEEMKLAWEEYENENYQTMLLEPESVLKRPKSPQLNSHTIAPRNLSTKSTNAISVESNALTNNLNLAPSIDYDKENSSKYVLLTTLYGYNVRVKATTNGLDFTVATPEDFTVQQIITANEIFHMPLANPRQSLPHEFIVDRDGTLRNNRNTNNRITPLTQLHEVMPSSYFERNVPLRTVDLDNDYMQLLDNNSSFVSEIVHNVESPSFLSFF